jgi:uncharacterized RDD family membrane protein YckC
MDKKNHASLVRRLLAMVYDFFLLLAILLIASGLYTIITVILTGDFLIHSEIKTNDVIHDLQPIDLGWLFIPYLTLIYLSFFCYFWIKTGQTLGMASWKIKLISSNNKSINVYHCVVRIFFAIISISCFGLGYLCLLFGSKKTWHDKLSKTEVIHIN